MAVADSCGLWSDGGRVCSVAGEFPSGVWRGGRVPTSSMSRHGAPRDILITLVRIMESRPYSETCTGGEEGDRQPTSE